MTISSSRKAYLVAGHRLWLKTGHISSIGQNSQSLRETDVSHFLSQVHVLGMAQAQETNVYNLGYSEITVTESSTKDKTRGLLNTNMS